MSTVDLRESLPGDFTLADLLRHSTADEMLLTASQQRHFYGLLQKQGQKKPKPGVKLHGVTIKVA